MHRNITLIHLTRLRSKPPLDPRSTIYYHSNSESSSERHVVKVSVSETNCIRSSRPELI